MTDSRTKIRVSEAATPAASEQGIRRSIWIARRSYQRRQWRDALLRRMLALSDAAAVLLMSVSLGTFLGGGLGQGLWSAIFAPAWILLAKLFGLYDRDQRSLRHLTVDELPTIFIWALTGTAALAGVFLVLPIPALEVSVGIRLWLIVGAAAFVFRATMRFLWRHLVPPERALIIGSGPLAEATRRKVELFPDIHVALAGARAELPVEEVRKTPDWAGEIDRVILASGQIDESLIAEVVGFCRRQRIKLSVIPPARGMFGTAVQLNHIADLPVVEYNTWDASRSTVALKRVLDVVLSLIAILVFAPVFAVIALAVIVDSRGPVVFGQLRAGYRGHPFRMYKFRTMVSNAEELLPQLVAINELPNPMFKLTDDPRITRVGRFLRRTSLDELPQLFNVLRGEMSMVGPRPEELELVERYPPEHRFRLDVKPGMTGPMQIYGRGQLRFDERLAVEREYIENLSLTRDLRIMAMTLAAVVSGRGAY